MPGPHLLMEFLRGRLEPESLEEAWQEAEEKRRAGPPDDNKGFFHRLQQRIYKKDPKPCPPKRANDEPFTLFNVGPIFILPIITINPNTNTTQADYISFLQLHQASLAPPSRP